MNLYQHLPPEYQTGSGFKYANYDKVKISLPNRFLVVAPTGSGKTNLTINLLLKINAFSKIYLFAGNTEEALWRWFVDKIREVEEKLSKKAKKPVVILEMVSDDLNDLPPLNSFSNDQPQTAMIFDDMLNQASKAKLVKLRDYWTAGRKKQITPFFLSQDYFGIDTKIRRNTGILILKTLGSSKDKKRILAEYADEKTVPELNAMFEASHSNELLNFFMIDKTPNGDTSLKYRHNFTAF